MSDRTVAGFVDGREPFVISRVVLADFRCDECREARNRTRPSQTRQTPTEAADQPYSDPLWDRYR